jgi:hypothetical protein
MAALPVRLGIRGQDNGFASAVQGFFAVLWRQPKGGIVGRVARRPHCKIQWIYNAPRKFTCKHKGVPGKARPTTMLINEAG